MTTHKRTPLDRSRVLAAARDLADTHGLAALSMRSLATELAVVPMALYKHVADRDDLVGGMIDLVIAEYDEPDPDLPWRDAVTQRVLSARQAQNRHPWMRAAIETAVRQTPGALRYMNAVAGEFIDGGLSVDLTHHAMHALGYRIWGFNPEAFANAPAPAAQSAEEQKRQIEMMTAQYPHVTAIAMDAATRTPQGACDDQSEFEFTLALLLDAFERLHATGWVSRQPRS